MREGGRTIIGNDRGKEGRREVIEEGRKGGDRGREGWREGGRQGDASPIVAKYRIGCVLGIDCVYRIAKEEVKQKITSSLAIR